MEPLYALYMVFYLNTHAEEKSRQTMTAIPYEACMKRASELEQFVQDNPKMLRVPPQAVSFICLRSRSR